MDASFNFLIPVLKSVGILSVLFGVLIFVLYLIKKIVPGEKNMGRSVIKPIDSFFLTSKDRIVLLDVLGDKILVGITQQNISYLTKIDKELKSFQFDEAKAINFADYFKSSFLKNKSRVSKKSQ
jgi:flagellar protein FliO/FliZ